MKIEFENDSTFKYNFSGDLINQELTGTYFLKKNIAYLKFIKNKDEIESKRTKSNNFFFIKNDFSWGLVV